MGMYNSLEMVVGDFFISFIVFWTVNLMFEYTTDMYILSTLK